MHIGENDLGTMSHGCIVSEVLRFVQYLQSISSCHVVVVSQIISFPRTRQLYRSSVENVNGNLRSQLDSTHVFWHYESGLINGSSSLFHRDRIHLSSEPIEGSGFAVVELAELNSLNKVRVWIPGIPEEPRLIFSRLAKQNQGLNTSGWRVLHRKEQRKTEGEPQGQPDGQLRVLGVDDESLKVLRELGGKVHLELSKVTFMLPSQVVGGRAYVFLCFHFDFMQKFRFQYQFEGKGIENNFGRSVKLSDKKIQNGRHNPRWLPISNFLSHYAS